MSSNDPPSFVYPSAPSAEITSSSPDIPSDSSNVKKNDAIKAEAVNGSFSSNNLHNEATNSAVDPTISSSFTDSTSSFVSIPTKGSIDDYGQRIKEKLDAANTIGSSFPATNEEKKLPKPNLPSAEKQAKRVDPAAFSSEIPSGEKGRGSLPYDSLASSTSSERKSNLRVSDFGDKLRSKLEEADRIRGDEGISTNENAARQRGNRSTMPIFGGQTILNPIRASSRSSYAFETSGSSPHANTDTAMTSFEGRLRSKLEDSKQSFVMSNRESQSSDTIRTDSVALGLSGEAHEETHRVSKLSSVDMDCNSEIIGANMTIEEEDDFANRDVDRTEYAAQKEEGFSQSTTGDRCTTLSNGSTNSDTSSIPGSFTVVRGDGSVQQSKFLGMKSLQSNSTGHRDESTDSQIITVLQEEDSSGADYANHGIGIVDSIDRASLGTNPSDSNIPVASVRRISMPSVPEAFLVDANSSGIIPAEPMPSWWKPRRVMISFGTLLVLIAVLAITMGVLLSNKSDETNATSSAEVIAASSSIPPTSAPTRRPKIVTEPTSSSEDTAAYADTYPSYITSAPSEITPEMKESSEDTVTYPDYTTNAPSQNHIEPSPFPSTTEATSKSTSLPSLFPSSSTNVPSKSNIPTNEPTFSPTTSATTGSPTLASALPSYQTSSPSASYDPTHKPTLPPTECESGALSSIQSLDFTGSKDPQMAIDGENAVVMAYRNSVIYTDFFVLEENGWRTTNMFYDDASYLYGVQGSIGYRMSIALKGTIAFAGYPLHATEAGDEAGVVLIYEQNDQGFWVKVQDALVPDDGGLSGALFGRTVQLVDDLALVGAFGEDACYVFRNDGTKWGQTERLAGWQCVTAGNGLKAKKDVSSLNPYHYDSDVGVVSLNYLIRDAGEVVYSTVLAENHTVVSTFHRDSDDRPVFHGVSVYARRSDTQDFDLMQSFDASSYERGFGRSIALDGGVLAIGGSVYTYVFALRHDEWEEALSLRNAEINANVVRTGWSDIKISGQSLLVATNAEVFSFRIPDSCI